MPSLDEVLLHLGATKHPNQDLFTAASITTGNWGDRTRRCEPKVTDKKRVYVSAKDAFEIVLRHGKSEVHDRIVEFIQRKRC